MQVQCINNQNKNINYSGLYKIPAKNIGEKVFTLVKEHKCVNVPSSYLAPKFWYILTPDNKEIEDVFENAFLENVGKYWKVDIKDVLNKQVCETLFGVRKTLDNGKEDWVEREVK